MYCENCGHKLNENNLYCADCGTKVNRVVIEVPKKSNKTLWIVLGSVFGGMFLLAFIGIIFFILLMFSVNESVEVHEDYEVNDYYDYDDINY